MSKIKYFLKNNYYIRFIFMLAFYWPLYFMSGLFKRNRKIWLVSCQHGFIDNPKYFYIYYRYFLKSKFDVDLIWMASTSKDYDYIVSLGFKEVVLKKSLKGLFFSLIAKVYIVSYGMHEFFQPLSKNVFIVNLWHGIGIKNLIFKSEVEPSLKKALSQPFSKLVYPSIYTDYNLFLSTSELMTEHFSECFAMSKEKFYISEYPRCKLFSKTKNEAWEFIRKYEQDNIVELVEQLASYDKTFIYMPTWRDNNPDFLTEIRIDWGAINNLLLAKNYFLILKLHPACKVPYFEDCSNIFTVDSNVDIYPVLLFTDCLITDYSSIYFDYLLANKNIALFTFDYQEYMRSCRDFAYPYDDNMIGYKINNVEQLFDFFENFESVDFSCFKEDWSKVKNRFWTQDAKFDEFVKKIVESI